MAKLKQREIYSYRNDPAVPKFEDDGPVAFMDGDCALCAKGARIICKLDRRKEFKICPTQSGLGNAVLVHYGLDPSDPDSWLYLADGQAHTSIDAMIRVGRRLGGAGQIMRVLSILPRFLQDWVYRRIARNRYRVLGRTKMCALPDPELRSRLIE